MANIIRIRKLKKESDLRNVLIPVDKNTYTSDCKFITILDLKTFILSGYTGTETYTSKYKLPPFWNAGGIIAGDLRFPSGFTNISIYQMFDWMLYSPTTTTTTTTPPTTTTTTTPASTTTTSTSSTTTTTSTSSTTTTTTTEAPTTTTTTTIPFWTYTVQSASNSALTCSAPVDTVYSGDNFWQSGMYLWVDTSLTIPYSGGLFIKEDTGSLIYDLLGGNNVGNTTGDSC